MPTAEQCRAYAAEYHHLGQEADVFNPTRLGAMELVGGKPVPKKAGPQTPMEIQPVSGPRDLTTRSPWDRRPCKKPKQSGRPPHSANSQANAENL